MKKILTLLSFFMVFTACKSTKNVANYIETDTSTSPNYNLEKNWAVLPNKYTKDFAEFASKEQDTLQADVFYVYPTLNSEKDDLRWNVPIDDEKQQNKVLNRAVLFQASAFATAGKVYVPLYRQAHLRSYSNLKNGGEKALLLAYSDVKRAFELYLKKYNNGRPIIIASHSQGSTHTKLLLKDFFDEKPLQKKLIAAYVIGTIVKPNQFKSIKVMTKPNETGGFVGWNTFKKGYYSKKGKDYFKGSVTSNPITWNLDKTTTLEQHKGFLYSNKKLYENALEIEITDGLVWTTTPKFPGRLFMSFMKNYHVGDINLFWKDIQQNAVLRTYAYLKNNTKM